MNNVYICKKKKVKSGYWVAGVCVVSVSPPSTVPDTRLNGLVKMVSKRDIRTLKIITDGQFGYHRFLMPPVHCDLYWAYHHFYSL